MDYGVKVSKTGKDALSATADDLILTSQRNCLKVKAPQATLLTVAGGSGSVVITHNLGFAPIVIAFVNYSDIYLVGADVGILPIPFSTDGISDIFKIEIDETQATVSASGAIDGTYYVLYFLSETESAS